MPLPAELVLVSRIAPKMMRDLRLLERVEFRFTDSDAYASAERDGDGYMVTLPSDKALRKRLPSLSREMRRAKTIASVAEELSHIQNHDTCHPGRVVKSTIREIRKYVPAAQLRTEFMQERIANLEETSKSPEMDSCPDRLEGERQGRRLRRRHHR